MISDRKILKFPHCESRPSLLLLEKKKKEGGERGLKLHSTETSNCKVESHFCGGQKSALFESDGRKGTRTAIDGH